MKVRTLPVSYRLTKAETTDSPVAQCFFYLLFDYSEKTSLGVIASDHLPAV